MIACMQPQAASRQQPATAPVTPPTGGATRSFAALLAPASQGVAENASARRFDESGLLGRTTQPGSASTPYSGNEAPALAAQDAGAALYAGAPEPKPGSASLGQNPDNRVHRANSRAQLPSAARATAGDGRADPQPAMAIVPLPVRRASLPDLGGTPARPHLPARSAAASSPVQVSLLAAEEGLRVVARTGMLDPAERIRLRDAVAALLARHGHTATIEIRAVRGVEEE